MSSFDRAMATWRGRAIERLRKSEERLIPADFVYQGISGLSREVEEKLTRVRPQTLGQASRIPGITPAAISLTGSSGCCANERVDAPSKASAASIERRRTILLPPPSCHEAILPRSDADRFMFPAGTGLHRSTQGESFARTIPVARCNREA